MVRVVFSLALGLAAMVLGCPSPTVTAAPTAPAAPTVTAAPTSAATLSVTVAGFPGYRASWELTGRAFRFQEKTRFDPEVLETCELTPASADAVWSHVDAHLWDLKLIEAGSATDAPHLTFEASRAGRTASQHGTQGTQPLHELTTLLRKVECATPRKREELRSPF